MTIDPGEPRGHVVEHLDPQRTTSTSGCIAFRVIAESIGVLPLTIELVGTDI
jgi:hypothetical protein